MKRTCLLLSFLLMAALWAADTPFQALSVDSFTPVVMHGMVTGAKGWYFQDNPRFDYIFGRHEYLSGQDCFKLEVKDGVVTFNFTNPLHKAYQVSKRPICFGAMSGWPYPPAASYLTTGRVRFTGGTLVSDNGIRLKPSEQWQPLHFSSRNGLREFRLVPANGATYSFADIRSTAVYPKVGGSIALPDGGKLTRFLQPKNASYLMRWSIANWRGWFWKLTGVALPIETVDVVKPTPGAFAAIPGKTAPGGWQLSVNKGGITLVYGEEYAVAPALFDYLRLKLNCNFYHHTFEKIPRDGSVASLPAIERTAKPRFQFYTGDGGWMAMCGGVFKNLLYTFNTSNYYHIHGAVPDHIFNVILPMELYFKSHPEYYMKNSSGKRVVSYNPFYTNPCLADPAVRKLMIKNVMDYMKGQASPHLLDVGFADDFSLCHCDKCVAMNGGSHVSNSDSVSLFTKELAAELKKQYPNTKFMRSAYVTRKYPPAKYRDHGDNVLLEFCAGHDVFPCSLHVDCELNRRGFEEIKRWGEVMGDKSKIAFMTYRDIRPYHHMKVLDRLTQYGTYSIYTFLWKGYSPATYFVTSRWNLGEDPEALVAEFDNAYYGAGGKYVHKINQLVEQYAVNYKHTPEELKIKGIHHFCIWGGALESRTLLDRKTFDEIYRLFDQALEAAKNDRNACFRIADEEKFYLGEDLLRYNAASCQSDAELVAFGKRVKRLVDLARKYRAVFNNIMYGVSGRDLMAAASGIPVGNTKPFWADEPSLDVLIANPVKTLRQHVEKIRTGVYFVPGAMKTQKMPLEYEYQCPPRLAVGLPRLKVGNNEVSAELNLPAAPTGPLMLAVEGLDDDKAGHSLMQVRVNGTEIFKGENLFPEKQWGRMGFTIPAATLKAGKNIITIANVTPDFPSRSARASTPEEAANDTQWGWIEISEVYVMDPNGDFRTYANGGKPELWGQNGERANLPLGEIKAVNGKLQIKGSSAKYTAFVFFRGHKFHKVAITPNGRARVTVKCSGKGTVRVGMWGYRPYVTEAAKRQIINKRGYRNDTAHYGSQYKTFELTENSQIHVLEFKFNDSVGFVIPEIAVAGNGTATIENVTLEVLQP